MIPTNPNPGNAADHEDRLAHTLAPLRVHLPQPGDVCAYLQDHPRLAEHLLLICRQVWQEFGDGMQAVLEVYRDPESDDRYLTLYVRQAVYEPKLLVRIEKVSKSFEERLEQCSGSLLITTDFRPPGWKRCRACPS